MSEVARVSGYSGDYTAGILFSGNEIAIPHKTQEKVVIYRLVVTHGEED